MTSFRRVELAVPDTGEEEWQALREPLESGWLAQGSKVEAFEQAFAARHSVECAVATTSGTTALHLALVGLGVQPGDEIIVPAFTWVATASVIRQVGATPVFVDVRSDTFNIDCDSVDGALSPRTRAVMAVHLFGLCADMDALHAAVPAGVSIIEDAACAAGAAYRNRHAGGLGTIGCFSFHPRKVITTGEGGMVTLNDPEIATRLRMARNHGLSVPADVGGTSPCYFMPDVEDLGFNYRMTDIQAAIGLVQLGKLDRMIDERAELAAAYIREFSSIAWLELPRVQPGYRHAWQAFVVTVDHAKSPVSRNEFMLALGERGIVTRPGTQAVSTLAFYRDAPGADKCPVAKRLQDCTFAIPLHNRMDAADLAHVIDSVRECASAAEGA